MKNKILILVICFGIIILQNIGFAFAFEFDNLYDYNVQSKTAIIKNCDFWLLTCINKGKDLAYVTLTSPHNKIVARGEDRLVGEFNLTTTSDLIGVLDNIYLKNMKNRNYMFRGKQFKYKKYKEVRVNDYKTECQDVILGNGTAIQECSQIEVGNHLEIHFDWIPINNTNTFYGGVTYEVGVFVDVKAGDWGDWIPSIGGVEIEEWATWTESLNVGLITYYNLNGTSGVVIDSTNQNNATNNGATRGVTGIIDNAFDFDGVSDDLTSDGNTGITGNDDRTLNVWIKLGSFGDADTIMSIGGSGTAFWSIVDGQGGDGNWGIRTGNNSFELKGTQNSTLDIGNWVMLTATHNGTSSLYRNGVLDNSSIFTHKTMAGKLIIGNSIELNREINAIIDEVGVWNRSLSQSEITQLYNGGVGISWGNIFPNITILFPKNITYYETITHLNYTNSSNAINCWFSTDGGITNSSPLTCGTNFTTTSIGGSNIWKVYSNDSLGVVSSDTIIFFINEVLENNQTFNNQTSEANQETFIININYNTTKYSNIVAYLVYNGTSNLVTNKVSNGNNLIYTKPIYVPLVSSDTNVSFYWSFDLTNSTGYVTTFNSTSNNQTILNINLDDCSTNTINILNYTLVDEDDQLPLTIPTDNGTIELDVSIYSTNNLIQITNYTSKIEQTNNASVCINDNFLNTSIYSLFSIARYGGSLYSTEYHHIQNFTLDNSTINQSITLYDLLSSRTTNFKIIFKDSSFLLVPNAVIQIQRQYVSEGVFKTVEAPLTSSTGETVAHLLRDDVKYNFVILKDGQVLASFENLVAFCEDIVSENCIISLNAFSGSGSVFDYDSTMKISYSINYNKTTRLLSVIFATSDGTSKNITLNSVKADQLGNTSVCSSSLISSSGTLSCTVPVSLGNETIYITLYVDGVKTFSTFLSLNEPVDFGDAGFFLMLILLITLPFMFIESKAMTIFSVILGFIAGSLLFFIKGGIMATGSSIMWLLIVGMILIYKLNSGGKT